MLPARATVREALNFCVDMKLPRDISPSEREEAIDRAVRLLKLEDIVDAVIGSPGMDMYVLQRITRRVCCACICVWRASTQHCLTCCTQWHLERSIQARGHCDGDRVVSPDLVLG